VLMCKDRTFAVPEIVRVVRAVRYVVHVTPDTSAVTIRRERLER
jgi:hypothetical protein